MKSTQKSARLAGILYLRHLLDSIPLALAHHKIIPRCSRFGNTWLFNSADSILIAAVWHSCYN